MDYPLVWDHATISAVHEWADSWSLDFAEGGGIGVQKFEYQNRPRIGERVSYHSHGLGSPVFAIVIGERMVRDFPEDWRGFSHLPDEQERP